MPERASASASYPGLVADALWCSRGRPDRYLERQRRRLDALIAHARVHAPLYRERYRDMAENPSLQDLPPLLRRDLVDRFDECVTDPAVQRAAVSAFISDPRLCGAPFLNRYHVWLSSGGTQTPIPLVHDAEAVAVYRALTVARGWLPWLTARSMPRRLRKRDAVAVLATGIPHYVGAGLARISGLSRPWPFNTLRVLSIDDPLPEIVCQLNAFQPVELIGYAYTLLLLAEEQRAGRLAISPVLIGTSGDKVTLGSRAEIESIFGAPLRENYGAAEFPRLAWSCRHGSLHVSADWVILEPVDAEYRPVPPGQPSTSVLLTNLANSVQPLIRCDLGDSVVMDGLPCPCGNPLPRVTLHGRRTQPLVLRGPSGDRVAAQPVPLATILESTQGIQRFQIIQCGPSSLTVRLESRASYPREAVWQDASSRLKAHLSTLGLGQTVVSLDTELPQIDPRSGKLRLVYSALDGGASGDVEA